MYSSAVFMFHLTCLRFTHVGAAAVVHWCPLMNQSHHTTLPSLFALLVVIGLLPGVCSHNVYTCASTYPECVPVKSWVESECTLVQLYIIMPKYFPNLYQLTLPPLEGNMFHIFAKAWYCQTLKLLPVKMVQNCHHLNLILFLLRLCLFKRTALSLSSL